MISMNRWPIVLCIGLAFAVTSCGDDDDPITPPADCECLSSIEGPPDEFVYVANADSDNVTVINPRDCCVVATIPVGDNPGELNASADGEWVFVSNNDEGTVTVIHTEDNDVHETVTVGAGPLHSFWNPDHTELWVKNDDGASVSVIDLATLNVTTIPTGAGHGKMAMAPGDTAGQFTVYVSNISDNNITAINGNTKQVEATIPVGVGPHGMDYSSMSKKVYNASDAGVEVIATEGAEKNTVLTTIVVPTRGNYMHSSPDGSQMWMTSPDADQVVVIDCVGDSVLATVTAGDNPDKIAFMEGDVAAISNVLSAELTLINMNTLQLIASVDVGGLGYWNAQFMFGHRQVKESLDGEFAYVPNGADDTFTIIHVPTRAAKVLSIPTGGQPGAVIVAGPTGGGAYPR
jgi:YVTN family beta-propeller protein